MEQADPKAAGVQVFKSDVVKKTVEPVWEPMVLKVSDIVGNNVDVPLKITVFDWDSDTKSKEIGSFTVPNSSLFSLSLFFFPFTLVCF
jgi:Ca2+-dependent lipid-binding protein